MAIFRAVRSEVGLNVDPDTGFQLLRDTCETVGRAVRADPSARSLRAKGRYIFATAVVEARVVAGASPNESLLEIAAQGGDVYGRTASKVIDKIIAAMRAEPVPTDDDTKALITTAPTYRVPPMSSRAAVGIVAALLVVVAAGFGIDAVVSHHHAGVDKSSPSYIDGYEGGQQLEESVPGQDPNTVCQNYGELATLNPLPNENLSVAIKGCVAGYLAAEGP